MEMKCWGWRTGGRVRSNGRGELGEEAGPLISVQWLMGTNDAVLVGQDSLPPGEGGGEGEGDTSFSQDIVHGT